MSRLRETDSIARQISDLKRRIEILERAPRVANITTTAAGPTASSVSASQTTSSPTYTDLATVGPQVSVAVPTTNRLLIIAAAKIAFTAANSPPPGDGGKIGYQIEGALNGTLGPFDLLSMGVASVPVANPVSVGTSFAVLHMSLVPETVTVTLKYLALSGSTAPATFSNRVLVVLPL